METLSIGYYIPKKPTLLKQFDKTAKFGRRVLIQKCGYELADLLVDEIRQEFEHLIPHIPYVGSEVPALNYFTIVSAMELAVFKAMKHHGKSAPEAWEVCHETLQARLKTVPQFVCWLARTIFFSSFTKYRARKLGEMTQKKPLAGGFAFNFVEGNGKDFDWGVDYTGCSIRQFMMDNGGDEFAPYVCMSDIALSKALGWGLTRTITLAGGFDHCDFRFKKGGKTNISSRIKKQVPAGLWNG